MDLLCKRGICEVAKDCISISKGDKGWRKFQKEFDEDEAEYGKDPYQSIYVTYLELYGEKWKADSLSYFCDVDFFVYQGENMTSMDDIYNFKNYGRYHGFYTRSKTFEGLLINTAKKVKKIYGNWDINDDFITPAEIKNHDRQQMYLSKKLAKDDLNSYSLVSNPKHKEVTDVMRNRRWLKWFSKTEYCKKNWENEFKSMVAKKI
jgi:hypothetical protein